MEMEPIIDETPFAAGAGLAGIAALVAQSASVLAQDAAAAGGGHYAFQPDELQNVLNQWLDLQNTVNTAQGHQSQQHSTVQISGSAKPTAPGNDQASDVMATAVSASSAAYSTYLANMQKYIDGYVEKLQAALKNYNTSEQEAAASFNRQA